MYEHNHRYSTTMTQTDALMSDEEGMAPDKQPPQDGQLVGEEESAPMVSMGVSAMDEIDETKEYDEPATTLPESTHTFLFTEPIGSTPFLFGCGIAAMSYACLILALLFNIRTGIVPANVETSVRIAQYLSVLIALLMEEEIPTGLHLMRRISKPYLKSKLPEACYWRFIGSCLLRVTMGYLFLLNVIVILVQASGVIEIFYDVLALQFIQQLDDIAFSVSKIDVLGKRMQRATTTKYFSTEFVKQKGRTSLKWAYRVALKGVYFINLMVILAALIGISIRQTSGYYQCQSVTVQFGDEVWDEANVNWPGGEQDQMVLVYSYFNGVFVKDGNHQGRPMYVEMKKSDRNPTPFDGTAPDHPNGYGPTDPIIPAVIKYCDGHWIFTHEFIRKSSSQKHDAECNWLARSPETVGFDLLDVSGDWDIWYGTIESTGDISITCNECSDDSDCNLNGSCNKDTGECDCDVEEGVEYLGVHCEVQLKDECRTIIGADNSEWSIDASSSWMGTGGIFQEYSRPAYLFVDGPLAAEYQLDETTDLALVYSGSRWFNIRMSSADDPRYAEYWAWQTSNYHAFWVEIFQSGSTLYASDPTTGSTPVGTDFHRVGEKGDHFGPFGALYPMANITGHGYFRCKLDMCTFCPDGMIGDDIVVRESDGVTCGGLFQYTLFLLSSDDVLLSSDVCQSILQAEPTCCPKNETSEQPSALNVDVALAAAANASDADKAGPCAFCPNGVLEDGVDTIVPEADGATCGDLLEYTQTLLSSDTVCQQILLADQFCCVP